MEDQGAQITNRAHHSSYNGGGGGGREDCWSEGATATLIEAWGDRYLQLSRGNLRQKDWKEVAEAVNARQDGVKPRRTDVQCKNRVDTLKKKYKLEKSKPTPSKWPFYSHLDHLIGPTTSTKRITASAVATPPPPLPPHKSTAVTFTVKNFKEKPNSNHSHNPNPNSTNAVLTAVAGGGGYSGGSSSKSRMNSQRSSGSSHGGSDHDGGGGEDDVLFDGGGRKQRVVRDSSDGAAFRELARAVLKFGEIYERIETSKQQQMMELERQRMEVMKDVEFQRMQMFMEAQLDIEKFKRPPTYSSATGED